MKSPVILNPLELARLDALVKDEWLYIGCCHACGNLASGTGDVNYTMPCSYCGHCVYLEPMTEAVWSEKNQRMEWYNGPLYDETFTLATPTD